MSTKYALALLVLTALTAGCASVATRQALECAAPEEALTEWVRVALPPTPASRKDAHFSSKRLAEVERLALICPNNDDVALVRAIALVESGEAERAVAVLDGLLARRSRHPEAAALRARLALEGGNPGFAVTLIERQQRVFPDSAILFESRASIHFVAGEHDEALLALSDAEILGAPRARVAFNRGLVLEAMGDVGGARSAYEIALELDPRHELARRRLRGLQLRDHSSER